MRKALLPLLLALAALPARAQEDADPDEAVLRGVLANGPSLTEEESRNRCLDLGHDGMPPYSEEVFDAEGTESSCQPIDGGELERVADRRYFWTRYAWTILLPPEDERNPEVRDSIREEEIVLFSAPLDGSRLTAEWHMRYETATIADVEVMTGPVRDDAALLAVLSCWNGTAGCWQNFLLRDARGWRSVRQRWTDQLPEDLRGGMRKAAFINPMTLQGRAALYSDDDPNCCPSRTLYFRVRLDGDALVLRDHRVVANPSF